MTKTSFRYFSHPELVCRCGCQREEMAPGFMLQLELLREQLGFPLYVASAFRCPEHNVQVSTTGANGPHTTGRAIDIRVYGGQAHQLVRAATERGFTGIGVRQRGDYATRFIHLDTLVHPKRPWVWSY